MEFDESDPWHKNAHLMFGFQCESCGSAISTDDIPDIKSLNSEFLEYCVQASNLAKSRGWVCAEDFSFLCGNCNKR